MIEIFVIGTAAFIGFMTQRILGFGTSLFLVPALLLYVDAPTALGVTLLVGTIICLAILFSSRNRFVIPWRIVIRLFIATIPGSILGIYILTKIDKSLVQIIVGILIIVSAYIQEYVFPKPHDKLRVSKGINISGFAAGVLGSIAALAPPPILLYLRSYVITPEQIRQSMSLLFILMNIITIPLLFIVRPESFNDHAMTICALLLPVMVVATWLGSVGAKKLNTKHYHRAVYIVVNLAAISSILFGINELH